DGQVILESKNPRKTKILTQDIKKDSNTISFLEQHGCKPGDVLIIPDTRQIMTYEGVFKENLNSEKVTVSGLNNQTKVAIVNTKNKYDHFGWRKNGITVSSFHVGNLTQDIILESENPNGTRAHCLFTRHADITLRGVSFNELGRTTTSLLGPENQIGRYSIHFHHCLGRHWKCDPCQCIDCACPARPYQFIVENCSISGSPKWGIAIHGSHFGLVRNCVVYDCAGAGIVTEDPLVYGNTIDNNLIIGYRDGSGQTIKPQGGTISSITARAERNKFEGDHWHNKMGLGLASAANNITNNVIYNCLDGIGMAGFRTTTLKF